MMQQNGAELKLTDSVLTDLKLTVAEFNQIVEREMPFAIEMGLVLEKIEPEGVQMRAAYNSNYLRPGGTISGPVMMALSDAAIYAVVLSRIGPVELAVTTNLSINFLRKPEPGDLLCDASILKLGKRLAVCEARIHSEKSNDLVAHSTATYSIPKIS